MTKSTLRFLSLSLIMGGLFLALSAVLPIAKYELFSPRLSSPGDFISPLTNPIPVLPGSQDLTQAKNWFVGEPGLPEVASNVKYYKLTVPKLKINDALVEMGGNDLSSHLIHFKNTSPPGKPGNAVVFGHSTLPQLYNPKNFLTIFTYLPSLKKDDEIFVDYDGIKYKFQVTQMFEVKPEDIQILEQRYDNSYLTLVTCVPPGTYLKRLVVRAKIVPNQDPESTRSRVN